MAEDRVTVKMGNTIGFTDLETRQTTYYGPGDAVSVPARLARALGVKWGPPLPPMKLQEDSEPIDTDPPYSQGLGTPLPEDFPYLNILTSAGIHLVEETPHTEGGLVEVPGIGPGRARAILEALVAMEH